MVFLGIKKTAKKNWGLLWFILIIFAGLLVRFYCPTFRSLWGDEGHSVYSALAVPYNITGNLIRDSHLPLYFVVLSAWIRCFGLSEYILRLLSIIIGLAALPVFFKFARELFDEQVALTGTVLLAFSPLAVMHSQEIRVYGLAMLLSLLSAFYFWRLLQGHKDWLSYFIFTILLLLTQVYALLLLAAQLIILAIDYEQERNELKSLKIGGIMVLAAILAAPFYFKVLFNTLPDLMAGIAQMAFAVFPFYLKFLLVFFVLSLGETIAPWHLLVVLPAGIIFAALIFLNLKWFQDRTIIFLLVLCFVPIFGSVLLPSTMPKYLIIALPFYLLLVSRALVFINQKSLRYGLLVVLLAFQSVSLANYYSLKEYHNSNQIEPWRQVADQIKLNYKNGDIIIASTRFVPYRLLNYYLNMVSGGDYHLYSLQKDTYSPDGGYLIYDQAEKGMALGFLSANRIWLINHIGDDRGFPPGYIDKMTKQLNLSYRLIDQKKFIPYSETLVAKLPIKRHVAGSSRITVSLYQRR